MHDLYSTEVQNSESVLHYRCFSFMWANSQMVSILSDISRQLICRTNCDEFAELFFSCLPSYPILFHLLGWSLNTRKHYSSSDNEPKLVSMVTRCATDIVNSWLVSNL